MGAFDSIISGAAGGATVAIVIKAVDQYSKQLKTAGGTLTKFGGLASAAGLAAAGAIAAFGVSAVKAAAQAQPIEAAFKRLARDSDALLRSLDKSTAGIVENTEMQRIANKALIAGIDQNKLPELFKNAAIVAKSQGKEVTQFIDDLTTGIVRVNDRALAQLGITVDLKKVYDDYAKKLGKTSSDLTETEKRTALLNKTQKDLNKIAKETGIILGKDYQDKLNNVINKWSQLKQNIGNAILPVLESLLIVVVEATEAADANAKSVIFQTSALERNRNAMYDLFKIKQADSIFTQKVTVPVQSLYSQSVQETANKLKAEAEAQREAADALKKKLSIINQINSKLHKKGDSQETTKALDAIARLQAGDKSAYKEYLAKQGAKLVEKTNTAYGDPRDYVGFTSQKYGEVGMSVMNDFVSRPGQEAVSFSPNDTIIGVKDPSKLSGGGGMVNNFYGVTSARDIARELQRQFSTQIKVNA